ncbi:hypothetical protein [Streptomyces sp. OspMP-M43]|uniref:hypothetical protein n=1 Tax=Streptomyces sp. OspMP-M43 TaxID=1839781 RepID=UPI00081B7ADE|nr:hypothetical protein [Streptomyces sp. OspMP-M43]SCE40330.1 hypothetical protein GA0115261_105046 [Streptomyces sp. OspMP-M43]
MSVRRALKQALAALTSPGWPRVHTGSEQLHQVLAEQTAAANRVAAVDTGHELTVLADAAHTTITAPGAS